MEKSKLFIELAKHVNIIGNKKSQRGIIAKRALKALDRLEMKEFEEKLVKFNLPQPRFIKVKGIEEEYYITL